MSCTIAFIFLLSVICWSMLIICFISYLLIHVGHMFHQLYATYNYRLQIMIQLMMVLFLLLQIMFLLMLVLFSLLQITLLLMLVVFLLLQIMLYCWCWWCSYCYRLCSCWCWWCSYCYRLCSWWWWWCSYCYRLCSCWCWWCCHCMLQITLLLIRRLLLHSLRQCVRVSSIQVNSIQFLNSIRFMKKVTLQRTSKYTYKYTWSTVIY